MARKHLFKKSIIKYPALNNNVSIKQYKQKKGKELIM